MVKSLRQPCLHDLRNIGVYDVIKSLLGDSDPARRSIVKRKTAEYLVYAEELHKQYLDSSGADGDRWKQQSVPRPVARLRAGLSELANYKVCCQRSAMKIF